MTNERKRELENKLNGILTELREIVEEMDYGVSLMVLPYKNGSSALAFIHECKKEHGLISVDNNFVGVLDKEFDFEEEYNKDE